MSQDFVISARDGPFASARLDALELELQTTTRTGSNLDWLKRAILRERAWYLSGDVSTISTSLAATRAQFVSAMREYVVRDEEVLDLASAFPIDVAAVRAKLEQRHEADVTASTYLYAWLVMGYICGGVMRRMRAAFAEYNAFRVYQMDQEGIIGSQPPAA